MSMRGLMLKLFMVMMSELDVIADVGLLSVLLSGLMRVLQSERSVLLSKLMI